MTNIVYSKYLFVQIQIFQTTDFPWSGALVSPTTPGQAWLSVEGEKHLFECSVPHLCNQLEKHGSPWIKGECSSFRPSITDE